MLFVPTRKCGKEEEADKRKNNSDNSENGRQQPNHGKGSQEGRSH